MNIQIHLDETWGFTAVDYLSAGRLAAKLSFKGVSEIDVRTNFRRGPKKTSERCLDVRIHWHGNQLGVTVTETGFYHTEVLLPREIVKEWKKFINTNRHPFHNWQELTNIARLWILEKNPEQKETIETEWKIFDDTLRSTTVKT